MPSLDPSYRFNRVAMNNQFSAFDDVAIDHQLRFRGWIIPGANPRGFINVLNSGERIAIEDIFLPWFLDEVIQKLAISSADIPVVKPCRAEIPACDDDENRERAC